jgi:hypothetical protein
MRWPASSRSLRCMKLEEALKQLKALGNEKTRAHNTTHGAGGNQFGVKHGDTQVLAKKIGANHEFGHVSLYTSSSRVYRGLEELTYLWSANTPSGPVRCRN